MKWILIYLFLPVLYLCSAMYSVPVHAQQLVTGGFQYKPMITVPTLSPDPVLFDKDGVQFALQPRYGFSAGSLIRHDLFGRFSMETGINLVHRNYEISLEDGSRFESERMRLVSYEIPLLFLLYIQLGEQLYMNNSFGAMAAFFPSHVEQETESMDVILFRRRWVMPGMQVNHGYEWRTRNSGFLYVGFSYHHLFNPVGHIGFDYPSGGVRSPFLPVEGNYFTIDLRYFFHADPEE